MIAPGCKADDGYDYPIVRNISLRVLKGHFASADQMMQTVLELVV
jgi:hypothetical protein